IALAKLIGRRPDAEAVLRAAGRFLAREAYMTVSPVTRGVLKLMPSMISRPLAFRKTRRIAHRYLNGNVRRVGQFILLEVPRSVTLGVARGSTGGSCYESTLRELLRLLVGTTGSVEHTRCEGRGEGSCEWRADWRGADHVRAKPPCPPPRARRHADAGDAAHAPARARRGGSGRLAALRL